MRLLSFLALQNHSRYSPSHCFTILHSRVLRRNLARSVHSTVTIYIKHALAIYKSQFRGATNRPRNLLVHFTLIRACKIISETIGLRLFMFILNFIIKPMRFSLIPCLINTDKPKTVIQTDVHTIKYSIPLVFCCTFRSILDFLSAFVSRMSLSCVKASTTDEVLTME